MPSSKRQAAGVLCKFYRPASRYAISGRRSHRKLAIMDGKIGYTGGFGIDKRWLGNARDKTEWHDAAVRVEGPVVAQMQAIFSAIQSAQKSIHIQNASFLPDNLIRMALIAAVGRGVDRGDVPEGPGALRAGDLRGLAPSRIDGPLRRVILRAL